MGDVVPTRAPPLRSSIVAVSKLYRVENAMRCVVPMSHASPPFGDVMMTGAPAPKEDEGDTENVPLMVLREHCTLAAAAKLIVHPEIATA